MIQDTIVALATASGVGAIAVLRLSGNDAIAIADGVFCSIHSTKKLKDQKTHTIHLGTIKDGESILDEVLVSLFKNPQSYTGEDVVEFSCHGSHYIQNQLLQLLLRKGARLANPGEFTLRAFINGKMDLAQAEGVADLIASDSEAAHKMAMQQMRGGYSLEIEKLREQLMNFASLIELELDFPEEDVEFANRDALEKLLSEIRGVLKKLADSFALGNVLKNGIPVAIVGAPNAGKSTLLNALLNEDRAIVSEIEGTTRDTVEDELNIDGIPFRFIDTAGIRETVDNIESIGIKKAFEKIEQASVVLYLFDAAKKTATQVEAELAKLDLPEDKMLITIANKVDAISTEARDAFSKLPNVVLLSAKQQETEALKTLLLSSVKTGALSNNEMIVSNSRHYASLHHALEAIIKVQQGLDGGLTGEFLAMDIRTALDHLGEITGQITSDDLLGNIFSRFCIGK
jgi:tRNA modification GTPase